MVESPADLFDLRVRNPVHSAGGDTTETINPPVVTHCPHTKIRVLRINFAILGVTSNVNGYTGEVPDFEPWRGAYPFRYLF
jgi:hypothetical protein